MKKALTLLTAIATVITLQAQPNVWNQKSNFLGTARYFSFSFSLNGKGYIGCGQASSGPTQDVWAYDAGTDSWSQVANYGGGVRYSPCAFVIGNYAYAGGGIVGSTIYTDFYKYDPVLNNWTSIAAFIGTPSYDATGFTVGTLGYVACGSDGGPPYLDELHSYNPTTNTWTALTDLPDTPRSQAQAFVSNGKAYLIGGLFNNTPTTTSEVWEYVPASDSWTQKGNFPGGNRMGGAAFNLWDQCFYGCGFNNGIGYNDFWEYDASGDTWTQRANYGGQAQWGGAAFAIGGYGYFGTGNRGSGNYAVEFWRYSPMNVGVEEQLSSPVQISWRENQIIIKRESAGDADFQIYDLNGKLVGNFGIWSESETVNIGTSLAVGMYTYRIVSETETLSGKLQIIR